MRVKNTIIFFLILSALIPQAYAADFGEDQEYLGQVVDDYENDDNVAAAFDVIHNSTLECMELNYTSSPALGYENFSTYVEIDENNRATVTSDKIDIVTRYRTETGHVYKDMGAGHFSGDYEFLITVEIDGGHTDSTYEWFSVVSNTVGDYGDQSNFQGVSLRTTLTPRFQLQLWDIGGAGASSTYTITVDTPYYLKIARVGSDLDCYVYSDAARTNLLTTLSIEGAQQTAWRYILADMAFDIASGPTIWITCNCANLSLGIHGDYGTDWAYEETGHFYTDDILNGDPGLAYMYNATIPAGTSITVEFSTDNETWMDHDNQAGSDTLLAGYEALDLRDIYNGTIYRRVNMTSNGLNTPRLWQDRFVTVTTITTGDGLFPGLAIGISLLIIGAIYAIEKRR